MCLSCNAYLEGSRKICRCEDCKDITKIQVKTAQGVPYCTSCHHAVSATHAWRKRKNSTRRRFEWQWVKL